jgi:hypothetical protein
MILLLLRVCSCKVLTLTSRTTTGILSLLKIKSTCSQNNNKIFTWNNARVL